MNKKNSWQPLEFARRIVLSEGRFVRKFIEIMAKNSLAIASEICIRIFWWLYNHQNKKSLLDELKSFSVCDMSL